MIWWLACYYAAFDDQKAEHEAADTARTLTLESKEKFYGMF